MTGTRVLCSRTGHRWEAEPMKNHQSHTVLHVATTRYGSHTKFADGQCTSNWCRKLLDTLTFVFHVRDILSQCMSENSSWADWTGSVSYWGLYSSTLYLSPASDNFEFLEHFIPTHGHGKWGPARHNLSQIVLVEPNSIEPRHQALEDPASRTQLNTLK